MFQRRSNASMQSGATPGLTSTPVLAQWALNLLARLSMVSVCPPHPILQLLQAVLAALAHAFVRIFPALGDQASASHSFRPTQSLCQLCEPLDPHHPYPCIMVRRQALQRIDRGRVARAAEDVGSQGPNLWVL